MRATLLIHGLGDLNDSKKKTPTNLIYGLIDPRTRMIRYIGLSSIGTKRPKQHAKARKPVAATYCQRWIKQLQRLGLTYEIVVLDVLDDASELDEAECWWILFGRACGWPLTNLNEGGVPSAETLARRAERKKQKALRAQHAEATRFQKDEERNRVKAEHEAAEAKRLRAFRSMLYSPAQIAAMERHKRMRSQPRRTVAMKLGRTWTCQGCGRTKWEIWCLDCDIHWSGKTLAQLREESAVHHLDMVLSMTGDPEKVATS